MNKKYKLTNESISFNGRKLYRIKALKDFANVEKGDLGGYVESENNLSQEDNCWIYGNAKVYDDAKIYDNAIIYDNARIFGYAEVYNNASVYNDAKVYGKALVYEDAEVYGHAEVFEDAEVYGYTEIYDHAEVYGHTKISGYTKIYEDAEIYGHAEVFEDAEVYGNAKISGNALIYDNAIVNRNYKIIGKVIDKFDDIIEIQNPEGRLVTAILRDNKIFYNVGCQNEISEKVFKYRIENKDGGLEKNPYRKYYYEIIDMVNYHFKNKIKEYTPED